MDKDFLQNFFKTSDQIVAQSKMISWPIPQGVDKTKGELGLLPDDNKIEAWQIPASSALFLRFLVLITKAKTILELGTSIGFSAMWLALGAKEVNGHVFGTEIFADKATLAKENFDKAGLSEQITLFEEDILNVLKNWKEKKVDFVFMDADKQRYATYWDALQPILSDEALIVVDNVGNYRQYMTDFLDKCSGLENFVLHFLNIDHGLLLILKNGGENLGSMMDIFNSNRA